MKTSAFSDDNLPALRVTGDDDCSGDAGSFGHLSTTIGGCGDDDSCSDRRSPAAAAAVNACVSRTSTAAASDNTQQEDRCNGLLLNDFDSVNKWAWFGQIARFCQSGYWDCLANCQMLTINCHLAACQILFMISLVQTWQFAGFEVGTLPDLSNGFIGSNLAPCQVQSWHIARLEQGFYCFQVGTFPDSSNPKKLESNFFSQHRCPFCPFVCDQQTQLVAHTETHFMNGIRRHLPSTSAPLIIQPQGQPQLHRPQLRRPAKFAAFFVLENSTMLECWPNTKPNVLRASIGTMHPNLTTMWAGPFTLDGGVRSSSTKIATAGVGCGGSVANQDSTVGTLSPAISIAVCAAAVKRTHLQMGS
uniref:C2H2-type domain-containing protein n=1 Tax=Romanomermis culicivorax TaxID=13658 RepID=A0A915L4T4_ROMCU